MGFLSDFNKKFGFKRLERGHETLEGAKQVNPALKAIGDRAQSIAKEQRQQAADYKQNAPELKQKRFNIAGDQLRNSLAGNIGQVRQGANQRGLLYSGLRQGAEAGLKSQLAGDLAIAQTDISKDVEDRIKELEYGTMESDMKAAMADQAVKDDLYRQQLAAREAHLNKMSPVVGAFKSSLFS